MQPRVTAARWLTVSEEGSHRLAEVEVELEGNQQPLVATLIKEGQNRYELQSLVQEDADIDIDWYDNNLHQAYVDVKPLWFEKEEEIQQFVSHLLAFEHVRDSLDLEMLSIPHDVQL